MDAPAAESNYSARISLTQFVCCVLVVFIHNFTYANYAAETSGLYSAAMAGVRLARAAANIAVPAFFMLSGILFYRNYTLGATLKKWSSRVKSLAVPYLIWNTVWLLFNVVLSYIPGIGKYIVGRTLFEPSLKNVIEGVFAFKYYGPLWYVAELMLLTLLCPVFYILLKNKLVGLISLAALAALYDCGLILSVNRGDSVIYYCVGAYIGLHCFEEVKAPVGKYLPVAGGVLLAGCVAYFYLRGGYFPEFTRASDVSVCVVGILSL